MKHLLLSFLLIAITTSLFAQDIRWQTKDPTTYPLSSSYANYLKDNDPDKKPKIKVLYSRPYKKDRIIFGELVKYGEE